MHKVERLLKSYLSASELLYHVGFAPSKTTRSPGDTFLASTGLEKIKHIVNS